MTTLLSPKNDVVFKLLFSKPENNALLISFLTAVLRPVSPILVATVTNPDLVKSTVIEKGTVLDVVVELQDKSKIDIEMQFDNQYNFKKRVLFYLCRLHQSQLVPGQDYKQIRPTVAIAVLGYHETNENNFHSIYELRERTSTNLLCDDLSVHLIELRKLDGFLKKHPDQIHEAMVQWSRFFEFKDQTELEALAMEQPIFKQAETALHLISGDPEARQLAEDREKARINYLSAIDGASEHKWNLGIEKGIVIGKAEGKAEALHEVVLKMVAEGIPPETISKLTNLSLEEIKRLRSESI